MSNEIKPALTKEEWATLRYRDGRHVVIDAQMTGELRLHGAAGESLEMCAEDLPATIALAISALPDDSEYKITRADVEACKEFDFNFWGMAEDSVLVKRNDCEALQRLAAKLAALLPPDA